MIDQSIIFENTDERFNQPNISFGELNKSFINNIIDNDIDVNEDEILALYFLQKPEENNTKTQNFSEIEKIDEKINFKDSSEIDISNITKDKIQNFSDEIEKIDKNMNSKDNSDIDISNITKDKIQNFSDEVEKIEKRIYSKDNSEIDENNTTKDRSSKNIKIKQKKTNIKIIKTIGNKIFNIVQMKKINNKRGRLLKNSKRRHYIKYHDKFKEDNIIKKIKTSFIKKTMNYINKENEIYLNKHKIKKIEKLINRIPPTISTSIKKENNLKWFDSKLKDIFSDKISRKYSKYPDDYNKNQIEKIYKENEAKNVISILDKKFRDMYNIYSKDIKLEGFLTLEDDLKKERKLMEKRGEEAIDDYLEKYQNVAQNLEKIFLDKKSRNYNKNKNSK
jgi:hypothetical protein